MDLLSRIGQGAREGDRSSVTSGGLIERQSAALEARWKHGRYSAKAIKDRCPCRRFGLWLRRGGPTKQQRKATKLHFGG